MSNGEYSAVCEVGNYGDLNIEDPTVKKVKAKDENIEELIQQSIEENSKALSNK
jgi:hypothetical protein